MTAALAIADAQTAYFKTPIMEIQVNQGFTNKDYESKIMLVGFYPGAEWCAFSAILAVKDGYMSLDKINVWLYFKRLASGNSQAMLANCRNDSFWPTGLAPEVGCIVIWQAGDSKTEGHTGLCISVDPNGKYFTTLEGNSIPAGNPGNEAHGYTIAVHVHVIGAPHSTLGLNFDRCIYMPDALPA